MDANGNKKQQKLNEELAEQERFNKKAEKYKKDNWAYREREEIMEFPDGRQLRIAVLPSGARYLMNGRTRTRITKEWIEKQQMLLKAAKEKEQADKDNGITEAASNGDARCNLCDCKMPCHCEGIIETEEEKVILGSNNAESNPIV